MPDRPTRQLIVTHSPGLVPARLFTPTPKAAKRVLEFFTAQITNDHTRKAYLNATRRFAAWCEAHGLDELADIEPFHVAAFVKDCSAGSPRRRSNSTWRRCACCSTGW
jgi:integrase/recombinase XerC